MMQRALLLLLALFLPFAALQAEYKEDQSYYEIYPSYPGTEPGKLDVVEFFWYNCPHCYDFEPHLETWLKQKPDFVNFTKIPMIFNPVGRFHAETYYALELLGLGSLHHAIFKEIHNQHHKLDNPETMGAFLKTQGLDMDKFEATRKSFAVQTRVRNAEEMAKRFDISSVPNMVVAGTYRSGNVKSFEELIALVDFLIDKVQKEQVAKAPAAAAH